MRFRQPSGPKIVRRDRYLEATHSPACRPETAGVNSSPLPFPPSLGPLGAKRVQKGRVETYRAGLAPRGCGGSRVLDLHEDEGVHRLCSGGQKSPVPKCRTQCQSFQQRLMQGARREDRHGSLWLCPASPCFGLVWTNAHSPSSSVEDQLFVLTVRPLDVAIELTAREYSKGKELYSTLLHVSAPVCVSACRCGCRCVWRCVCADVRVSVRFHAGAGVGAGVGVETCGCGCWCGRTCADVGIGAQLGCVWYLRWCVCVCVCRFLSSGCSLRSFWCPGGGWVGLGWVKASPGRLPTVRAAFPAGPDWAAVPGCPVTRPTGLLTAPRPRGGARGREMPPCLCVCALVCLRGGGGGLWHTCLLHCCSALAHMARGSVCLVLQAPAGRLESLTLSPPGEMWAWARNLHVTRTCYPTTPRLPIGTGRRWYVARLGSDPHSLTALGTGGAASRAGSGSHGRGRTLGRWRGTRAQSVLPCPGCHQCWLHWLRRYSPRRRGGPEGTTPEWPLR